jgi:hypothetical protein
MNIEERMNTKRFISLEELRKKKEKDLLSFIMKKKLTIITGFLKIHVFS